MAADYLVRDSSRVVVLRPKRAAAGDAATVPTRQLMAAIGSAHALIDELYSADLDIAAILGLRNLSAFVGELYAAALCKATDGLLRANPHQDGHPDLLLMDAVGRRNWDLLRERLHDKTPFSPFAAGGIEVKATCGSVPSPAECRRRGIQRPELGDARIHCLLGYDWKAHHRDTNNLVGLLWDFVQRRPRIAAMFYANDLTQRRLGQDRSATSRRRAHHQRLDHGLLRHPKDVRRLALRVVHRQLPPVLEPAQPRRSDTGTNGRPGLTVGGSPAAPAGRAPGRGAAGDGGMRFGETRPMPSAAAAAPAARLPFSPAYRGAFGAFPGCAGPARGAQGRRRQTGGGGLSAPTPRPALPLTSPAVCANKRFARSS